MKWDLSVALERKIITSHIALIRERRASLFSNLLQRNFRTPAPFQKLGTDVTELKLSFGKAYLASVYDFCSREIVSFCISQSPNLSQQKEMLQGLLQKLPKGAHPILHSDRGWQYQHAYVRDTLDVAGIIQSMSRKGNCLDNAQTEQLFDHIKEEFFKGQSWKSFEPFKADLTSYIEFGTRKEDRWLLEVLHHRSSKRATMHVLW